MPVAQTKFARRYKGRDGKYRVPNSQLSRFNGNQAMYWAKKGARMGALALSRLNTETKYVDTSGAPNTAIGNIVLLNPLVQGTTANTRVGDQVKFKSLDLRVAYTNTTDEAIWLRYAIVRDNAPNGITLASSINQLVFNGLNVHDFRNLDYGSRFDVFVDRVLAFQRSDPASGYVSQPGFTTLHIDLSKGKGSKNNKNVTDYGLGNAGTNADIAKGSYYLILMSSATTNNVLFSYDSRMKYIDN